MNYPDYSIGGVLIHHGIQGQKWGKRNGPPYPLKPSDHSEAEKRASKGRATGKASEVKKKVVKKPVQGGLMENLQNKALKKALKQQDKYMSKLSPEQRESYKRILERHSDDIKDSLNVLDDKTRKMSEEILKRIADNSTTYEDREDEDAKAHEMAKKAGKDDGDNYKVYRDAMRGDERAKKIVSEWESKSNDKDYGKSEHGWKNLLAEMAAYGGDIKPEQLKKEHADSTLYKEYVKARKDYIEAAKDNPDSTEALEAWDRFQEVSHDFSELLEKPTQSGLFNNRQKVKKLKEKDYEKPKNPQRNNYVNTTNRINQINTQQIQDQINRQQIQDQINRQQVQDILRDFDTQNMINQINNQHHFSPAYYPMYFGTKKKNRR